MSKTKKDIGSPITLRRLSDSIGASITEEEAQRFTLCADCGFPFLSDRYTIEAATGKTISFAGETQCSDCIVAGGTCPDCGANLNPFYNRYRSRMENACMNRGCPTYPERKAEYIATGKRFRESHIYNLIPGTLFYHKGTKLDQLPDRAEFINTVSRIIKNLADSKGTILYGKTGTAKTRILYAAIAKVFIETGKSIRVFEGQEFGNRSAIAFGPDGEGETFIDRCGNYDILVFDDFGKGVITERTAATLFAIVEKRAQSGKPILITTNDNVRTIGERTRGNATDTTIEPLFRRLTEFSDMIHVRGSK